MTTWLPCRSGRATRSPPSTICGPRSCCSRPGGTMGADQQRLGAGLRQSGRQTDAEAKVTATTPGGGAAGSAPAQPAAGGSEPAEAGDTAPAAAAAGDNAPATPARWRWLTLPAVLLRRHWLMSLLLLGGLALRVLALAAYH